MYYSVWPLSCVWLFATPRIAACPGFPVHHQLLEPSLTPVHRVSDAIQPSHPLSSPSPPALNLSQHQDSYLGNPVDREAWQAKVHRDTKSWTQGKSVLDVHWKDWCWSWNSNILAFWCEELTHWKRPWCWERLRAGGEGDDRGWDGWMASLTRWTWVWVNSGSWWWTGRPGTLQFTGSQGVRHDWATELNWTEVT